MPFFGSDSQKSMVARDFENFLKVIKSQKLKNKKLKPTNLVLWNSHFLNISSQMFLNQASKDFFVTKTCDFGCFT